MSVIRSAGAIGTVPRRSTIEETLALHIRLNGLPEPAREYRFHPERKWRFDFAFVPQRLAVECEGALYMNGRHTRGAGYEADLEKYNAAALLGWTVLRFSRAMVHKGTAIRAIQEALGT